MRGRSPGRLRPPAALHFPGRDGTLLRRSELPGQQLVGDPYSGDGEAGQPEDQDKPESAEPRSAAQAGLAVLIRRAVVFGGRTGLMARRTRRRCLVTGKHRPVACAGAIWRALLRLRLPRHTGILRPEPA